MENQADVRAFFRLLIVISAVLLLCFGGYSLHYFWRQQSIAKELKTWQPVSTKNYRIELAQWTSLPREKPPVKRAAPTFGKVPELAENAFSAEPSPEPQDEISMWEAQFYAWETQQKIAIYYDYRFKDFAGAKFAISPFPQLNKRAMLDRQFWESLLAMDQPEITVYVDPDRPSQSALVNGWAQGDRWFSLLIAGVALPLGLALLSNVLPQRRRLEALFKA